MTRSLELHSDGRLHEFEDDQAIKATVTCEQVKALIEALRFSIASTFTLAPPNAPETRVSIDKT